MTARTDALLFAEDPGAANFLARLPSALTARGLAPVLAAAGPAVNHLGDLSVPCIPVSGEGDAAALLARFSPRLVAVGTAENPRALGLRLVEAARAAGLPTVGLIDSLANAAFRFRGESDSPLAHAPDHLLVPDAATAGAFAALGFPDERIHACGHPHWDHVRAEAERLAREDRATLRARLFPGCPMDRQVVIFASEISTGLDPDQYRRSPAYTLTGNGRSQGRTEIVLDEFLEAAAGLSPKPWMVLRLHPKQGPEEIQAYLAAFDAVSSGGPVLELLHASDAVVGMSSMLLQEAALLGRATLSILPREEEKAWLPTIAMGATLCATRRAEIGAFLKRILDPARPPAPSDPFFGDSGTDSARRAAGFLYGLLNRGP